MKKYSYFIPPPMPEKSQKSRIIDSVFNVSLPRKNDEEDFFILQYTLFIYKKMEIGTVY
ncbi:hypothetical protein JCM16418A_28210 [Paenibacillus pini]